MATILTNIVFACGNCNKIFRRNEKGEKIYLNPAKRQNFNIYCSYCKRYYGKMENGYKTKFPPRQSPAILGERSDGICDECLKAGAFENYKKS